MKILLILIIFIVERISVNFAFTSSNTNQFFSISGYRTNNNPTQSSSVFCPSNPSSYPLKSIVVSNVGSTSEATLSIPDQPSSVSSAARARGPLLVFTNPSTSQCYLINFSALNSGDMNNMKVQFIYDYSNTRVDPTRSFGSYPGYGSPSYPSGSYTNSACGSVYCQNGGVCRYQGTNGYQCQCDSSGQWLGNDCSKSNPCMRSPCYNNGQCYYFQDASYYCVCSVGYTGSNCQSSLATITTTAASPFYSYNPCLTTRPCSNGGTCSPQNYGNGYICTCPQGYSGVNCQSIDYLAPATTVASGSCGNSSHDLDYTSGERIVGGKPVRSYTWPWIVSIQTASGGSHFCGGTLIDAYHVITAAHCFDSAGTTPSMFKIVAGLLNMRQMYTSAVQQLTVERIFRHEQYSSIALVNDITVIKLRTPAQFTQAVSPICLPTNDGALDPGTNQNVLIAGWGYTSSVTKQIAEQLQEATIQTLDINGDLYGGPGCNAWIRRGYSLTNNKQICAMSRDTRSDSCQGDSGGPLIGAVQSKWYLYGIVSYGDAVCASSTAAGVYTRVSAYIPWIQQKLQL